MSLHVPWYIQLVFNAWNVSTIQPGFAWHSLHTYACEHIGTLTECLINLIFSDCNWHWQAERPKESTREQVQYICIAHTKYHNEIAHLNRSTFIHVLGSLSGSAQCWCCYIAVEKSGIALDRNVKNLNERVVLEKWMEGVRNGKQLGSSAQGRRKKRINSAAFNSGLEYWWDFSRHIALLFLCASNNNNFPPDIFQSLGFCVAMPLCRSFTFHDDFNFVAATMNFFKKICFINENKSIWCRNCRTPPLSFYW